MALALGAHARERLALTLPLSYARDSSNGGVFGSLMGTPILNTPQAAVLGMHAINQRPWVDSDGKIVVRPIMTVALTYGASTLPLSLFLALPAPC